MRKIFILLFLCAVLISGSFWFLNQKDQARSGVKPLIGPAVQAVYASGTVEPSLMVPVSPRMGARLTALMAEEGQEIKKGDILAQMEDADLEQSVAQLRSKLDLAEREYKRRSVLHKTGALSKQMFDTTRTNLEVAKTALEKAEAEKNYLKLIAPEDGRIIRRDGEIGEYIAAGKAVFTLEGPAPLRITSEVDEEDIPLVQIGQKVLISADAFPNTVFEGTVSAITPMGDPIARSYRVRVAIAKESPLMTGMTTEINIITRENTEALLIPLSALEGPHVQAVSQGRIKKHIVTTGAKTAQVVEILSGLSQDDLILETFDPALVDDAALEIKTKPWTLAQ